MALQMHGHGERNVSRWSGFAVMAMAVWCAAWHGAGSARAVERPEGRPRFDRISVGFSQALRAECWAPVQLMLRNPGAAVDVEVVVAAEDSMGMRLPMMTRARVRLPAQATRRQTVYVWPGLCRRLVFEMYRQGRLTHRESASPRHIPAGDTLVLGLSYEGMGWGCWQERDEGPRLLFNSAFRFAELPERWEGYDAVDAIILGDLPPGGVTVMQERALVEWVRGGGTLIVNPGGRRARYEGTLIEKVLPVKILGTRLVKALPAVAEIYGRIPASPERIGLTEAVVSDGVVSLRMGRFPLVVSRHEGVGRVVFVAFDLSSERLSGRPWLRRFYSDIIEQRGRLPAAHRTRLSQEAAAILLGTMGMKVMARGVVGLFLGANLACMIVVLAVMRTRRERAFLILVIAAPFLALAINLFGRAAANVADLKAAGLHVLRTTSSQSEGVVAGYHALLSDTEADCDIGFPEVPSAFPRALAASTPEQAAPRGAVRTAKERYDFEDGDLKRLRRLRLRPRTVTLFQSRAMATLPGALEARATFTKSGIRFGVTNRSRHDFRRGFVAYNRNAAPIGDLAPGESTTVVLTGRTARGMMAGFSRTAFKTQRDVEEGRLANSLYSARPINAVAHTGGLVFGWVEGAPVAVTIAGPAASPRSSARTLWVVGASTGTEGRDLLLPKGSLSLRFSRPLSNVFLHGRWADIYGSCGMEAEFMMPQLP